LPGISRAEAVRRGLQGIVQQNEAIKTDGFGLWYSSAASKQSAKAPAAARSARKQ
jgi:hypothetical protein